jgi:hypothetical protein
VVIEDGVDAARQTFQERREEARDAVAAGRGALHSARDDLERRLAEKRAQRDEELEPEEAETT